MFAGDIDLALLRAILGSSAPTRSGGGDGRGDEAGVLVEDAAAPTTVRFGHALIQRACYDGLARRDRVAWHRAAAEAMDGREVATELGSDVARHRLRAVVDAGLRRALAVAAAGRAAQDAVRRLAFDDAAYWYGVEADLAAPAERPEADRASALVRRADALHRGGQVTAALDEAPSGRSTWPSTAACRRSRAAAALVVRNIGGPVSEEIAALCARARAIVPATETVAQAQLMGLHALALIESYRTAEAERLSREAMALAEATGDADALILAIQARQALDHGPGTLDERRELSRQAGRPSASRPAGRRRPCGPCSGAST